MLQQVMTAPGVIAFREVPTPKPQPGEVLVKIQKIGVCGSDIHVYHGEHPFTQYPITQGHEVSGEIAALTPFQTYSCMPFQATALEGLFLPAMPLVSDKSAPWPKPYKLQGVLPDCADRLIAVRGK